MGSREYSLGDDLAYSKSVEATFDRALKLSKDVVASASSINRVAKQTSADAAAWAFGQWELRKRSRAKFELADQMLFVREALEQSTHERVAAYHANLFPPGRLVADLTVGIGADLIALAKRGPTVGFEIDSERVELAEYNLQAHALSSNLKAEDCLAATWDFEYAFADPARRVEGRRTLDPTQFAPNPEDIGKRLACLALGAMKLSPLLSDTFLETLGSRLEFISFGGECREVLAITGRNAVSGRIAVHIESGEQLEASDLPCAVDVPSEFLFDSDPAAVRAHGLGTVCRRHDLLPLGDSNGYLTGYEPVITPWLRAYRVLFCGKGDAKQTRKALRELDGHVFEIKQRGVKADIVKLGREFSGSGNRPLSLVLWPDGFSVRHLLVEQHVR
jgi:hypothetical protein